MVKPLLFAFAISVQPLVSEDVLEPSIQNEVDHALSVAPASAFAEGAITNLPPAVLARDVFGTNGLDATSIAIKLVSAQNGDGRWMDGTNDVTAVAVSILKTL